MLSMGAFVRTFLKILTMLTDIWRKTIKFAVMCDWLLLMLLHQVLAFCLTENWMMAFCFHLFLFSETE